MATYRVGSDGKAQKGLNAGDYVVTGNGTYKIASVNTDGSYVSNKVSSALSTSNWDGTTDFDAWQASQNKGSNANLSQYTDSNLVSGAKSALDATTASKPGAWSDPYGGVKSDLLNKILNREDFKYDLNGDMLWNQYKDQYQVLGKMAMTDTVGEASGLTGGYSNTYAVTAGNQSYQNYLRQLNDIVPDLYSMAYDRYTQEGNDLYNQYGVVSNESEFDYNQYRAGVGDWQFELGIANDNYNNALSMSQSDYWNNKNLEYQISKDAQDQANWEKEFAYTTGKTATSKSSGSGGGSGSSGGGYTSPIDESEPKDQEPQKTGTVPKTSSGSVKAAPYAAILALIGGGKIAKGDIVAIIEASEGLTINSVQADTLMKKLDV